MQKEICQFSIPQSLDYFAIDKHSTAANRNHTMYESIKTQKRQYNEKVKTFLCAPLRSLRLVYYSQVKSYNSFVL